MCIQLTFCGTFIACTDNRADVQYDISPVHVCSMVNASSD